jgi:hypothetical protein
MTLPRISGADLGADEGVFLYAVIPADRAIPEGLTGIDDAPVELVVNGPLAAVVSRVALERPPGRRADLVAYNRVVADLAEAGAVAPVRFGAVLEDPDEVAETVLASQEGHLAAVLRDLAGHRQFNLSATYVEGVVLKEIVETDPEVRALRAYTKDLPEDAGYGDRVRLGELVARSLEVRSEIDAADLMDVVLPHVAAHAPRGSSGLERLLDVALLVHDDQVEALEATLEDLAEAVHERIHLRLVGPVAPFDFVGEL